MKVRLLPDRQGRAALPIIAYHRRRRPTIVVGGALRLSWGAPRAPAAPIGERQGAGMVTSECPGRTFRSIGDERLHFNLGNPVDNPP